MGQAPGQKNDRQREISAQVNDPGHRSIVVCVRATSRQGDEQQSGMIGLEHAQRERHRAVQRHQPASAGHQRQTTLSRGNQRFDLIDIGRVVEHQQSTFVSESITPEATESIEILGQITRIHTQPDQQTRQDITGIIRCSPRSVSVQVDEVPAIRKPISQYMRGPSDQSGLTDTGHPVEGVDRQDPARRHRAQDPLQLTLTADERRHISAQRRRHDRSWRQRRLVHSRRVDRAGIVTDHVHLPGRLRRTKPQIHPPYSGLRAP
nr:hypothetical protein [Nocardia noduli]